MGTDGRTEMTTLSLFIILRTRVITGTVNEVGEEKLYKRNVEIKCQLDATEVFIADLIACSTCFGHHYAHHQELKSIIQWLLVWCGAEGCVSGLQDAAASCKPDT